VESLFIMLRYETLVLARTEITNDELATLEKFFDKHVSTAQGSVDAFDKWGKLRLAYPVNKSEYGMFILARFKLPKTNVGEVVREIDNFLKFKCTEFVLRHVSTKVAKNAPAVYQRPDSVDTGRSGNLDSFLKDNKMDNLLKTVDNNDLDDDMDN